MEHEFPTAIFTATHVEALISSLKNIRPDSIPLENDNELIKVVRDLSQLTSLFFRLKNQEFAERKEIQKLKNDNDQEKLVKMQNEINSIIRSSYSVSLCIKSYIGMLNVYIGKRILSAIEIIEGINGGQLSCYEGIVNPDQIEEIYRLQRNNEITQNQTGTAHSNEENGTQSQQDLLIANLPKPVINVIAAMSQNERQCLAEHLKARRDLSFNTQIKYPNSYIGGIWGYSSCMTPYENKIQILAKQDTEYIDSEGKVCVLRKGVIRQVLWMDVRELLLKDQVVVWENAY